MFTWQALDLDLYFGMT